MSNIIAKIREANPNRDIKNIIKRALKLSEESGEVAEAVLSISSSTNGKNKTWDDVLEEAVDTAIVALDIALTQFPGQTLTDEEKEQQVIDMFDKKLAKWNRKRKKP